MRDAYKADYCDYFMHYAHIVHTRLTVLQDYVDLR